MSKLKKGRRVAFVLLWIATIALVFVWDRSTAALLVSGFGFIAMLFAFSARGWWPWLAALCSAGFVANWARAFAEGGGGQSRFDLYLSVIRGALEQPAPLDAAIVLSYELALPLLHLAAFLMLCIGLVRSRRGA